MTAKPSSRLDAPAGADPGRAGGEHGSATGEEHEHQKVLAHDGEPVGDQPDPPVDAGGDAGAGGPEVAGSHVTGAQAETGSASGRSNGTQAQHDEPAAPPARRRPDRRVRAARNKWHQPGNEFEQPLLAAVGDALTVPLYRRRHQIVIAVSLIILGWIAYQALPADRVAGTEPIVTTSTAVPTTAGTGTTATGVPTSATVPIDATPSSVPASTGPDATAADPTGAAGATTTTTATTTATTAGGG